MKFIFLTAFVYVTTLLSSNAISPEMFQNPFREGAKATTNKREKEDFEKPKKATVVLTYDDALHVHLDHALPLLDSLDLKATFYVSGYTNALQTRLQHWRAAAQHGHELGNHTLFHPCTGGKPGREFVKKEYDLSTYTLNRIEDEIKMTNTLLSALDGKTKRTFAYPCSDTKIGTEYYLKNLEPLFTGARAVYTETPQLKNAQLYNLGSYMVNGQTGDELIALVKNAVEKKGLLVFLFHGVGGEHALNVSLEAHRQLLRYLKQHQDEIWIAPMTEVAEHIKALQSGTAQIQ